MHFKFKDSEKETLKKYGRWHKWYAWHPVWYPGHAYWLEEVERKAVDFFGIVWIYRKEGDKTPK